MREDSLRDDEKSAGAATNFGAKFTVYHFLLWYSEAWGSEDFKSRPLVIRALCLYLRPQFRHGGKSKGKGGRPARGRVPRRTCRRSNYCGFAGVLGLFRAELSATKIGYRDFKMTTCSFQTSLPKWDPVTRSGS